MRPLRLGGGARAVDTADKYSGAKRLGMGSILNIESRGGLRSAADG